MAVCVDRPVRRIVAEGPEGRFGMLPGHIDFVSALVPGILLYETEDGSERFVAVNSGTLVKCSDEVRVAVRGAVEGDDLGALRKRARKRYRESAWYGLGMFGLVGWSVAVPIVAGIATGVWIDRRWPGDVSWTLTLLLAGAVLGAFNAWYWVQREGRND